MMATLKFHLFGKFTVLRDAQLVKGLDASKEQELLCYLLVRRDQCHPREALASLLWGNTSTEKSKKYLRQALWHVQAALEETEFANQQVLVVERDWVQLNLRSGVWLDVALFEQAFLAAEDVPAEQLEDPEAQILKEAIDLYRGDLLDGWYQDWCLFERERLQNIYLSMLDKLMTYSELHREYEACQTYGSTILRYDRARERTHRQLMHLQYMAGDRTGALRQYKRCIEALDEELGVKPERRTITLYEQICADRLNDGELVGSQLGSRSRASLAEVLNLLKQLHLVLSVAQKSVRRDIRAVEEGLKTMKQ
jgi:DNA-binding SARP family transcriptional activator